MSRTAPSANSRQSTAASSSAAERGGCLLTPSRYVYRRSAITSASIFISSSAALARPARFSGTGAFSSKAMSVACFMSAEATCTHARTARPAGVRTPISPHRTTHPQESHLPETFWLLSPVQWVAEHGVQLPLRLCLPGRGNAWPRGADGSASHGELTETANPPCCTTARIGYHRQSGCSHCQHRGAAQH